jgi:hypothetical protein
MNPITEFSAAPHLPYALRPESLASVLSDASSNPGGFIVTERDGEIFIHVASHN